MTENNHFTLRLDRNLSSALLLLWIFGKDLLCHHTPLILHFHASCVNMNSCNMIYISLYHLDNVLRTSVCLLLKYIAPLYLTLTTLQYYATVFLIDFVVVDVNSRLLLISFFVVSKYHWHGLCPFHFLSDTEVMFCSVVDNEGLLCAEWWPLFHSPPGLLFLWRITEISEKEKNSNKQTSVFRLLLPKNLIRAQNWNIRLHKY